MRRFTFRTGLWFPVLVVGCSDSTEAGMWFGLGMLFLVLNVAVIFTVAAARKWAQARAREVVMTALDRELGPAHEPAKPEEAKR